MGVEEGTLIEGQCGVVCTVRHTGSGAVSLQGEIITQQSGIKCVQRQTAPTLQTVLSHLAGASQVSQRDKEQWQTYPAGHPCKLLSHACLECMKTEQIKHKDEPI